MRILVVSPFLPYPAVPHAGGKSIHLFLAWLSERHETDLVARVFPDELSHVEETWKTVHRFHPVAEPASASPGAEGWASKILSYRRLAREAERIVSAESYDVALVEYTETAFFLNLRRWPPAALDCHDIVSKPWRRRWESAAGISRWPAWALYEAMSLAERRALRQFRVIFTRSAQDAEWARDRMGHADARVLPHPAGADMRLEPREEVPGRLLFLGAMGRSVNVDAALFFHRQVYPAVRRRVPEAHFRVAGGNPPASLLRATKSDQTVQVTGFVDDIGDEYRAASVFVAPILIGGGIIVKVLDAMAAGVPVVTTSYGNEGIGARDGEELFVADTADLFARRVISLLEDPALRTRVSEKGKEFARTHFAKERILSGLEATLAELAAGIGRH